MSLTTNDQRLLEAPTLLTDDYCCLCGKGGKTHAHHVVEKRKTVNMENRGPTIPLCTECHMAFHDARPSASNDVRIRMFDYWDIGWVAIDSHGEMYELDGCEEEIEVNLGELVDQTRQLIQSRDTVDYYIGRCLLDAKEAVGRTIGEWAYEHLGLSKPKTSKLMKVGTLPEELADRGITRLYDIYRAHQKSDDTIEEIAHHEGVLSRADFATRYFGAKPIEDVPFCETAQRKCKHIKEE